MIGLHRPEEAVLLTGLDGANPLGFLAALGTLAALRAAGEESARLSWIQRTSWVPALHGVPANREALCELLAEALRGRDVSPQAEAERKRSVRRFDAATKAVADKRKEITRRRLRGAERKAALESQVAPLEAEQQVARRAWLAALAAAVPRPELALGKRLDCTPEEYRQLGEELVMKGSVGDRDALDLLAAFGSDASVSRGQDQIRPTHFQFITGSGHQFFLTTVRELLQRASAQAVRATLFEGWTYQDEGLSMRWDPLEDRRYALMDRDPTASENKPRTMWMANLLAYRGLALFPVAPGSRGLQQVGWVGNENELVFTWPLWGHPASVDTVGTLLALAELCNERPGRATLYARGVVAAFRARRIKVGTGANFKLNFTPARAV